MKYLLDTHVLLWWLDGDKRLSDKFRKIIDDKSNVKLVSVVSIWETIIKVQAKKLPIKTSIDNLIKKIGFPILNIDIIHTLELIKLPRIHKDPFDRMLIAQAKSEDCILLTDDKNIKKYKVVTPSP